MYGRFDITELSALWLNEIERVERECFTAPWSRAGLKSDILSTSSRWYGAVERRCGRLAAFLGAHVFSDEGEIVNIATSPDFRRLGLAKRLISEFLLRESALMRIFLEVRETNAAARRLYEGFGFTAYAVRRNYYENPDEDAVLMRLIKY